MGMQASVLVSVPLFLEFALPFFFNLLTDARLLFDRLSLFHQLYERRFAGF